MKLFLLFSLFALLTATSCGYRSVEDGNIAIVVDSFSKNIHNTPKESGWSIDLFTKYHEVSSTDVRVELTDLQPKDKKGMKFEDVDLSVTVRLKKDKAVLLYSETKEINFVEHLNRDVLGYNKLVQIVSSSTTKAFQSLDYQEFMDDRDILEKRIEEEIIKSIADLMYDAYEVKDVNTVVINLMKEIEMAFQNRSLVAQKELLIKSKESLMLKEMELKEKELLRYASIAKKTGVSVKDLMNFQIEKERNEVLSDLSASNPSILLNVDSKK